MRLFIAIDIGKTAKNYLAQLQKQIIIPGSKMNFASGFHITIKFLGEVTKEKADEIICCLDEVTFEPFEFNTKGIGCFKKNGQIKVVWCGIQPKKQFIELHKKIEKKLENCRIYRDRKFKPHITIARIKQLPNKKRFLDNLIQLKKRDIVSKADSFVLYRSTLTSQGPIYNVVKRYKAR